MNQQVNNRFREYRVTVPSVIAAEIKRRAKEDKTTEENVIKQLLAKGLVSSKEVEQPEAA